MVHNQLKHGCNKVANILCGKIYNVDKERTYQFFKAKVLMKQYMYIRNLEYSKHFYFEFEIILTLKRFHLTYLPFVETMQIPKKINLNN